MEHSTVAWRTQRSITSQRVILAYYACHAKRKPGVKSVFCLRSIVELKERRKRMLHHHKNIRIFKKTFFPVSPSFTPHVLGIKRRKNDLHRWYNSVTAPQRTLNVVHYCHTRRHTKKTQAGKNNASIELFFSYKNLFTLLYYRFS